MKTNTMLAGVISCAFLAACEGCAKPIHLTHEVTNLGLMQVGEESLPARVVIVAEREALRLELSGDSVERMPKGIAWTRGTLRLADLEWNEGVATQGREVAYGETGYVDIARWNSEAPLENPTTGAQTAVEDAESDAPAPEPVEPMSTAVTPGIGEVLAASPTRYNLSLSRNNLELAFEFVPSERALDPSKDVTQTITYSGPIAFDCWLNAAEAGHADSTADPVLIRETADCAALVPLLPD